MKEDMKQYAQNKQDEWVLIETNNKRNGYFVDFGACDGKIFSNTYRLEKEFGWKGICCEPNKVYHKDLVLNRPNSVIDFRCVYSETGKKINFFEVSDNPELSVMEEYASVKDEHYDKRQNHTSYEIKTVSLNDLLDQHNSPKEIDFLSIDTEGSEYDILNNFNFDEYNIKTICVEHNWTPSRIKIFDLLVVNGYQRVFVEQSAWDDYYVKR